MDPVPGGNGLTFRSTRPLTPYTLAVLPMDPGTQT